MFKGIDFKSEPTATGFRVTATATVDPRLLDGVMRWVEHEAEAGRLFTIQNLAPEDFGSGVVIAQRISYNPSA